MDARLKDRLPQAGRDLAVIVIGDERSDFGVEAVNVALHGEAVDKGAAEDVEGGCAAVDR